MARVDVAVPVAGRGRGRGRGRATWRSWISLSRSVEMGCVTAVEGVLEGDQGWSGQSRSRLSGSAYSLGIGQQEALERVISECEGDSGQVHLERASCRSG